MAKIDSKSFLELVERSKLVEYNQLMRVVNSLRKTATSEQLETLPGVGPVTAQKILDYRQKHGAFSSLDELDAIPGIGPARIEQLRDAAAP